MSWSKHINDNSDSSVERIYHKLAEFEKRYRRAGLKVNYRELAPKELVLQLYRLSRDIDTTVHLVRILQQRQFLELLLDRVDADAVKANMGFDEARKDANDQYEEAISFCQEIDRLADNGEIRRTEEVGRFLEENLSAIESAAEGYCVKIIS